MFSRLNKRSLFHRNRTTRSGKQTLVADSVLIGVREAHKRTQQSAKHYWINPKQQRMVSSGMRAIKSAAHARASAQKCLSVSGARARELGPGETKKSYSFCTLLTSIIRPYGKKRRVRRGRASCKAERARAGFYTNSPPSPKPQLRPSTKPCRCAARRRPGHTDVPQADRTGPSRTQTCRTTILCRLRPQSLLPRRPLPLPAPATVHVHHVLRPPRQGTSSSPPLLLGTLAFETGDVDSRRNPRRRRRRRHPR